MATHDRQQRYTNAFLISSFKRAGRLAMRRAEGVFEGEEIPLNFLKKCHPPGGLNTNTIDGNVTLKLEKLVPTMLLLFNEFKNMVGLL